jgi:L-fucose mutarotase/ribose pyranase (RbsD/FucU family)
MGLASSEAMSGWERRLGELLPLYGHRNWIVVADSAYPAQARAGIETIVADADQIAVVRAVLKAIDASRHIRANVYTDLEIDVVEESDAPGMAAYRRQLNDLFEGSGRKQLQHEEIISRLDHAAEMFRILIIKTDMIIPYTSVFFELDCGYWNAEAEGRLRSAMTTAKAR